jgi:hypothetical protein
MSQFDSSKLAEIVATQVGRRQLLKGAGAIGIGAFLAGLSVKNAFADSKFLQFESVKASQLDGITLPKGYSAKVLISWGDPLFNDVPEFDPTGADDVEAQLKQFGDNNDGMSLFAIDDERAVLAVNNEYTNYGYLFEHDGKNLSAADVAKSQAAVGVSIFEIVRSEGSWRLDKTGALNRRITANTKMLLSGPAAGHALLKTKYDSTGQHVLGTFANCANGQTPWGTYLTCEENFNYMFGSKQSVKQNSEQKRYGIKGGASWSQWEQQDQRFDIGDNPNEANRFGWVVEIDPMNPESEPVKRTALGRFKHENAALTVNADGHVVVYMGDDARGEHIYKFVSKDKFDVDKPEQARGLLDEGTLYVARFDGELAALKGTGQWIALTHGQNGLTTENGFADQAEVLIYARKAATVVGATTMDRPEWVAVHPDKQTVFCTLTNNKERGMQQDQSPNAANPRVNNVYGQIIRWRPVDGDHCTDSFEWDLYVLAGNPAQHRGAKAGTSNITSDNMFNSPDGLGFDAAGRLWILTDGDDSDTGDFEGMGNNQMLCADPDTGEIRRFMTGPVGCEVTGICFSEDDKTMFVGIQHPGGGEQYADGKYPSSFPGSKNTKPRSSIVMITRDDGRSFAQA